jgi:RecB family exonuclease
MQPLDQRHLSAAALATYRLCPLRFRFRYLDNLYWSSQWGAGDVERTAMERGQHFHLMARRYYAGIDPGLSEGGEEKAVLEQWLYELQRFAPFTLDRAFYPELELRLTRPDLRLLSKMDLLVVDPDGRATIFDWKTEKRLPKRTYLASAAQTMVYRYLLCAAGGSYSPHGRFRPEEVTMLYFNPQHPGRPERFVYTEAQFQKDEQFFTQVWAQIVAMTREQFMPTTEERVCQRCEYQVICHGRRAEQVETEEEEWADQLNLSWEGMGEF